MLKIMDGTYCIAYGALGVSAFLLAGFNGSFYIPDVV